MGASWVLWTNFLPSLTIWTKQAKDTANGQDIFPCIQEAVGISKENVVAPYWWKIQGSTLFLLFKTTPRRIPYLNKTITKDSSLAL